MNHDLHIQPHNHIAHQGRDKDGSRASEGMYIQDPYMWQHFYVAYKDCEGPARRIFMQMLRQTKSNA